MHPRNFFPLATALCHFLSERGSGSALHHQKVHSLLRFELVHRGDLGMVEPAPAQ
jgi:hypothetical protein